MHNLCIFVLYIYIYIYRKCIKMPQDYIKATLACNLGTPTEVKARKPSGIVRYFCGTLVCGNQVSDLKSFLVFLCMYKLMLPSIIRM